MANNKRFEAITPKNLGESELSEAVTFTHLHVKQFINFIESIIVTSEHSTVLDSNIKIIDVDFSDIKQMTFEPLTKTIKGVFLEPGDYEFKVFYQITDQNEGYQNKVSQFNEYSNNSSIADDTFTPTYENLSKRYLWQSNPNENNLNLSDGVIRKTTGNILETTLKITVIADTRSHWLTIPSDPSDIYYKPDFDAKFFEKFPPSKDKKHLLGTRVRGTLNAHLGKSSDDDFFINKLTTGWHILLMTNGDVNSKASRKASSILSRSVGCFLSDTLNNKVFNQTLETAAKIYMNVINQIDENNPHKKAYFSSIDMQQLNIQADDSIFQKVIIDFQAIHETMSELVSDAVNQGLEALNEYLNSAEAKLNGVSINDLKSTLTFSLAKPIANSWFILNYNLRDDLIALIKDNSFEILSNKFDDDITIGQYVSPASINQSLINRQMSFLFTQQLDVLMLLNVGAQKYLFNQLVTTKPVDFEHALTGLKKQVLDTKDKEINAIKFLKKWSKGHHEDRTLLLLF